MAKKSWLNTVDDKRRFIDPHHAELSIARQCELIGMNRSSYYHTPCGVESEQNLKYMRLIDEQYLRTPFNCPTVGVHLIARLYHQSSATRKTARRFCGWM